MTSSHLFLGRLIYGMWSTFLRLKRFPKLPSLRSALQFPSARPPRPLITRRAFSIEHSWVEQKTITNSHLENKKLEAFLLDGGTDKEIMDQYHSMIRNKFRITLSNYRHIVITLCNSGSIEEGERVMLEMKGRIILHRLTDSLTYSLTHSR